MDCEYTTRPIRSNSNLDRLHVQFNQIRAKKTARLPLSSLKKLRQTKGRRRCGRIKFILFVVCWLVVVFFTHSRRVSSSASKLASLWGLWLDHWTWRRFTRIPKKCRGQSKELPLVKKKKGKTQETGKEKHIAKTQNSSRTRKRRRRRRRRRRSARKGRSKFKSKASSSSGRSNHTHVSHTHTHRTGRYRYGSPPPSRPKKKKTKKKYTHTHTHLQAHTHSYTHTGVGVWVCVARQSQVHAPRLLRFAIPKNSVLFSRPVASPFLNARTSANRYSLTHSLSLSLSRSTRSPIFLFFLIGSFRIWCVALSVFCFHRRKKRTKDATVGCQGTSTKNKYAHARKKEAEQKMKPKKKTRKNGPQLQRKWKNDVIRP